MSVPFSNTHLRVPRGFGTILEGLAREVLRDQPEDIPAYAAQYFDALLKQREESGLDPAEWAAKLEDRFYNNHAFKNTQTSPEKEDAPEVTLSEEEESPETDDDSSHPAEASTLSTTQPHVSEKADSAEVTDDEEENITTEEPTISAEEKLSEMKSVGDEQSEEENVTDEEKDSTQTAPDQIDTPENETDVNPISDDDIPLFHPEPRENSNVNVSSLELGVSENGGGNQRSETVNKENADSNGEEYTEVSEAVEMLPYSGLTDVDVSAAELGGTQETIEGSAVQDKTGDEEKESSNIQPEETAAKLSQDEATQGEQQEAEDQAQKINEGDRTQDDVSYEEPNESVDLIESDLDDNVTLKEESSVEINFEDVPEVQCITEDGEEKLMEDASIDNVQDNILEMQQKEESVNITASSVDQDVSDTEDQLKPEAEIAKKDYDEEVQSYHAAFDVMKEAVDTNNSNLNDSNDGERETGVKGISLSDQPTTETEKEIQEHETDHKGTEEISEGTFNQNQEKKHSNDPDSEQDETTDMGGENEEEKCTEAYNEMGDPEIIDDRVEQNPSYAVKSNQSIAGIEAEEENFEESVQHVLQENEQSPRTAGDSHPEDTKEEEDFISEEKEEHMRKTTDSVEREKKDETEKEEMSEADTRSADWTAADHEEEERPHDDDDAAATASANKSDKEECSRPQEEEDIMDIPLDDPEANRAAAKIQAGFRGHMTRKKMKPEDKTEGEEVSSTGDVLNSSQGVSETGRSGAVESDDTSVPEQ